MLDLFLVAWVETADYLIIDAQISLRIFAEM